MIANPVSPTFFFLLFFLTMSRLHFCSSTLQPHEPAGCVQWKACVYQSSLPKLHEVYLLQICVTAQHAKSFPSQYVMKPITLHTYILVILKSVLGW